ncbi:PilZ domain-containing protein [Altererythrobacter sp. CAU 1778]
MTHKQREARVPVSVSARLNFGADWTDVHIRNVSSRGLMAHTPTPPRRGDYVEIRRGPMVIVGRVAWSGDDRFGIVSQDTIDLNELKEPGRIAKRPDGDRRRTARGVEKYGAPTRRSFAEAAESSRRISRALDFAFMASATVMLGMAAAHFAYETLAKPMDQVTATLSSANLAQANLRD